MIEKNKGISPRPQTTHGQTLKQAMRTMARVDSELETITERQREEEALRGHGVDIDMSQDIDESYSFSLRGGANKNIFL